MVEKDVTFSEVKPLRLSSTQYEWIGKIVHQASELDQALCRLAVHLETSNGSADDYGVAYKRLMGARSITEVLRKKYNIRVHKSARDNFEQLLGSAEQLFDCRNALAHGYPRVDDQGNPLMWRKVAATKATVALPWHLQHAALPIDDDSLSRLSSGLMTAYRNAMQLVVLHWAPCMGAPPVLPARTRT